MKYVLTEKIGSGGMAEVFRAVGEGPEGFERAFVVKRIHPRLSDAPEFVRMFVDEAKISARLQHPNIVQVFDFAYGDGVYTIVMEPVEGVDLGCLFRAMERRGELPPPLFVAEMARQVCRGLEFAHSLKGADGQSLGIVHRDVTPPNIMVDWNGTVKILDFGLARAVQELRTNLTDAGTIKGKMSYVSPEQIQGQTADARSDIFSLGIVLHELLSVRRLFMGASDLETLKMVSEAPIVPPSQHNTEVKPGLDAIVMKALERNPDKRYQSAREMGDELEDFVLRRRYSTRALGEKARQLAPTEAEEALVAPWLPTVPGGELPAAPSALEGASSVIITESSTQRRRDQGTTGRRAAPPPVPAGAAAVVRAATPDPASTPAGRLTMSAPALWLLLTLGFAAVAATVLLVVVTRRPLRSDLSAAGRDEGRTGTVRVSLDSIPQGALVTATTPTAAGAPPAGTALGKTPLMLELPRDDKPIEFILTRSDVAPLAFRVIPNRDKDATAILDRGAPAVVATAATSAVTPTPAEDAPRPRRSRRARRAEAAAAAAAAAAARASAATTPTGSPGTAARPVALAPAVSSRR